jgi:hypothetical protein
MRHTLGCVYGNGIIFQYPHDSKFGRKLTGQHFTEPVGDAAVNTREFFRWAGCATSCVLTLLSREAGAGSLRTIGHFPLQRGTPVDVDALDIRGRTL